MHWFWMLWRMAASLALTFGGVLFSAPCVFATQPTYTADPEYLTDTWETEALGDHGRDR